jgi:hypothetical protein
MAKEPLTTRLDADTKQQVEEYANEHDIGQTEAARRLIRAGLAEEGYPVAATDGGAKTLLERLAAPSTVMLGSVFLLVSAGLMALAGLLASNGSFAGAFVTLGLSTVLMLLAVGTIITATLAQLALAQPLRGLVLNVEESETA